MAKRKLNKNVVVGVTLFTFLLMIVLSVIMLNQLQRRDPTYFIELAEQSRDAEQWDQAALYYNEAWKRSQDTRYLVEVGNMLLSAGELPRALGAWQQALLNDTQLIEAHESRLNLLLELATLNTRQADWSEILESADKMLAVVGDAGPQKLAFAHHARGLALVNLGNERPENVPDGLVELQKAAELAPHIIEYPLDLAGEYIRADRTEDGVRIYDALMTEYTEPGAASSRIRLAYAAFEDSRGNQDRARALYEESLALAGDHAEVLNDARVGYARYLVQQWNTGRSDGDRDADADALFDRAETLLRDVIAANPDRYDAYLELADLYRLAERYEESVEICKKRLARGLLRKGIKATRNKLDTFRLMITASDARVAQSLEEEDPERQEQLLNEAERFVVDARGEFPNHPRMYSQAGRVNVARGKYRAALEDLRRADEAYRAFQTIDWDNKVVLAQVHLQLREAGTARDVLEEVVPDAARLPRQNPLFWNTYVQALVETNALDRALAVVDRVLLLDPANKDAAHLKAAIFERKGRRDEAAQTIERTTGDRSIAALLRARQLSLEGNAAQAVEVLKEAVAEAPNNLSLVQALVNELYGLGRRDEARAIVDEAKRSNPDNAQLETLAVLMRDDLSESQREAAVLEQAAQEPDGYRRNLDLMNYYLRANDTAKALLHLRQAETHLQNKDTPLAQKATIAQHRALLRAMVRLAAQEDDEQTLRYARDAAIEHDVDGADGKSVVGLYHMAQKEFDLAINAFRGALVDQPTDSWTLVHLGQSLLMVNRVDESVASYERALRINPNEPLAHRDLAMLAKRRGDDEEFRKHLRECERLVPNDPWVAGELIAEHEAANPEDAIARREASLESNPNDVENIRRLAELADEANDLSRADRYFQRWLDLEPDNETAFVRTADYYRRTQRTEKGIELLNRFAAARPDPEAQAHALTLLADLYVDAGNRDQAEEALLRAASKAETLDVALRIGRFYLTTGDEPEKALKWLDLAVQKAEQPRSPQLPQALILRIVCNLNRGVDDLEAAKRDVNRLLDEFPDDPRGLLWRSEIEARTGRLDHAIASLSEYLRRRPDDPYGLLQRAQHQIAHGQTASAIADLVTLKRVDPLAFDLSPRILLANLYLRTGRNDRWIAELEELVHDAPQSARALEELVSAYIRDNRARDADRIITAELNRAGDKPDPRWLSLRARVSIVLGQYDKALSDLQRAAQLSGHTPETLSAVLDVFVQTERYAEGISYFEQHAGDNESNPMLLSRQALLRMLSGDKDRAVEQFRTAMARAIEDGPLAVRAVTADLRRMLPDQRTVDDAIDRFTQTPARGAAVRANDRILVRLYRRAENNPKAVEVIDRLVASATDDADRAALYAEKGEVLHVMNEYDASRQAYEESLRYDPDNWITLNNLAYLLSDAMGQDNVAIAYAKKAVATVENSATLDTLGWIYYGLGDYPSAIAELSRAVRLDPNSSLIHYHLGEAYRRNGQFSEATDVLQSARSMATANDDVERLAAVDEAIQKVNAANSGP